MNQIDESVNREYAELPESVRAKMTEKEWLWSRDIVTGKQIGRAHV